MAGGGEEEDYTSVTHLRGDGQRKGNGGGERGREGGGVTHLHGGGASIAHERRAEHLVLEVRAQVHLLGAYRVQHACLPLVVAGRRLQAQALVVVRGERERVEGEGEECEEEAHGSQTTPSSPW